jgi:hypothetical protein
MENLHKDPYVFLESILSCSINMGVKPWSTFSWISQMKYFNASQMHVMHISYL